MDSQILTTLQACPRLADYKFNLNLVQKGGKSNSLECGSLVHTILEFYYKALIQGTSRTDAIAIGYEAGNEYARGYHPDNKYITDKEEVGMITTPDDSDKWNIGRNFVFDTMAQYFDFWQNDTFTPLHVEHVLGKVIYEDEELRVLWKAKFDLIADFQTGIIPADHKTMKQRRDTQSLNNQFMGQCVLTNSRQVMINKIGFQSSLKPHEKFMRVLIPYSADRLHEWTQDIVPHYARMLHAYTVAEYFPPQFTHCENKYGVCNFKEVCEGDRNMRAEILRINFEERKKWDVNND